MEISPSQDRYLHTVQYEHRIYAHTDIHASSGIRNVDSSFWAGEDFHTLDSAATVIGGHFV
jgi:hypothetical protein